MAAIPRELIESELFGHEKGAFTGATERGIGKFEQAQGGTLFLDEIGDMPSEAQTRLLRVLQEGEFTAVGARTARRADVRIIAATHQDLRALINVGRFREDLYYRLNVVPIRLPPLRERVDDVTDLARNFLRLAEKEGLPRKTLSAEGIARLKEHSWPGNVRELENLMRRLAALCPDEQIPAAVIDQELTAQAGSDVGGSADPVGTGRTLGAAVELHLKRYFNMHGESLPPPGLHDRVLREVELPLIALTLSATRGNQLKAAELLGINRNTLRKRIRELDIPVTRGKKLM
jgi:two-component system nitrogen regulation response regulator GlnG